LEFAEGKFALQVTGKAKTADLRRAPFCATKATAEARDSSPHTGPSSFHDDKSKTKARGLRPPLPGFRFRSHQQKTAEARFLHRQASFDLLRMKGLELRATKRPPLHNARVAKVTVTQVIVVGVTGRGGGRKGLQDVGNRLALTRRQAQRY